MFWKKVVSEYKNAIERSRGDWNTKYVSALADLACAGRPLFVVRELIGLARGEQASIFGDRLRKGVSDPAACPGVKDFTILEWNALEQVAPVSPGHTGPP